MFGSRSTVTKPGVANVPSPRRSLARMSSVVFTPGKLPKLSSSLATGLTSSYSTFTSAVSVKPVAVSVSV